MTIRTIPRRQSYASGRLNRPLQIRGHEQEYLPVRAVLVKNHFTFFATFLSVFYPMEKPTRSFRGSLISKTVRVSVRLTDNLPRCTLIIRCAMDNPSPMPLSFVVKKGSKIFRKLSSLIPSPESSTLTMQNSSF
jgi:hypothetical protein